MSTHRDRLRVLNNNHPTTADLAYLLRHRELWPKDFKWDYTSRSCCAIGLFHAVWPNENMGWLKLSDRQFTAIFYSAGELSYSYHWAETTPEWVAEQLEAA